MKILQHIFTIKHLCLFLIVLEEPLDPEEFRTWGNNEFNTENIYTGEDKPSSNRIKEKQTSLSNPSYQ